MTEFSEKEFDVIGFAKKIMSEIESIRSFEDISDEKTGEGIQFPTESRINAFLRLIGLPQFVNIYELDKNGKEKLNDDVKFLNPGFGRSVRSELVKNRIENNMRLFYTDPNNNSRKIGIVLYGRDSELLKIAENIGSDDMNDRMTKAIYSPLDIIPNFPDNLGVEGIFKYKTMQGTEESRAVYKQLFPLITSYRKVLPLRNEIARPFTLSVKERRIDRDTILRKPFIEQVIRTRFVIYGSAQTDKEKLVEEDIRVSIENLLGEKTFAEVFGSGAIFSKINLLESFIIEKFLNAIKNLARKWVKANENRIKVLRETRPIISIKTGSARASTFGKRIELSTDFDDTKEGEKIKKINTSIATDESLISLLPTDENEQTDPKQSDTRNITPSALQNSFTELLNYDLNKNKEIRTSLMVRSQKNIKLLEKMRLEFDLMTGEFTGLSLPDIVIVITALFMIERNKLLNLLDKYIIDYMKTDKVLSTIVSDLSPNANDALESIKQLENITNQLFSLFQKEVESVLNRKKQTTKGTSIRSSNNKKNNPV